MIDAAPAPAPGFRPHRPWLAALLSFLVPGLGQAYAGRPRVAVLMALPVLLFAVVVGFVVAGAGGGLRNSVLSADFLVGVLAANAILLAWRMVAIGHAGLVSWRAIGTHERRTALMVVSGLVVLSIGMHAWIGLVVVQLNETLGQVFATDDASDGGVTQPPGGATDEPDEPVNVPTYQWDGTERINILLLGTDAAPGRRAALTDVILLVSVDPVEQSAVMISVPRDTGWVPLPDESIYPGGLFPGKVNELMVHASERPDLWCPDMLGDADRCGLRTIEQVVGLYLGVPVHHYAIVDMEGFAQLIDAVGGLELCLPGQLVDPEFDGSLTNAERDGPLILPAGCHPYGGLDALAYARSRKGWIEMPDGERVTQTDFERNDRQQRVLLALRSEIAEGDTFLELPAILRAVARTVSTDFPRDQAGDLASLLPLITGPSIERVVLGYPEFVDLPADPSVNYLLVPDRDAIRDEMARIFGEDELEGWYLEDGDERPPGGELSDELPAP